jgi:acylphosphatase
VRVHLEIRGRVQGVGFRWFVRESARRLGLAGWVSNREDGAVELAAEGEPALVERFVEEVSRGPAGARVTSVEHLSAEDSGDLPHPFTVQRT